MVVLGIITLFFFSMMLTVSDPFRVCTQAGSVGCFEASNLPWVASTAPLEGRGPRAMR